jgi:hypothetical protein
VLSQVPYPNTHHWEHAVKIVKAVPDDFALPEGQRYRSRMMELFAVEGDVMTGVGLWCPCSCSYHWVEYDIPDGADAFRATIYITDDVHGTCFHQDLAMNNWVTFRILIDGREVFSQDVQRLQKADGSGQKVMAPAFGVPAGARTMRFHIKSHAIDNNHNTELVISGGEFRIGRSPQPEADR